VVPLRQRLRDALPAAVKARDRIAVAALRSTLAAIDNAEAVDRSPSVDERLGIDQIPRGLGAAEAPRRILTEAQVADIVRAELAEREAAARVRPGRPAGPRRAAARRGQRTGGPAGRPGLTVRSPS